MSAAGSQPGPRLRVSVVDHNGRPVRVPSLAAWLAGVAPARARGAVTLALVSDSRVRTLNRQYRGIDRPTDVLSFPAGPAAVPAMAAAQPFGVEPRRRPAATLPGVEPGLQPRRTMAAGVKVGPPPSPSRNHAAEAPFLGDIVIARGVAARQAREARHAERTEWRVLALHGLLHLLGYDHDQDDGEMRRVERRLRRKGGLELGLIERGGSE